MRRELIEEKKWLQSCQDAYDCLREVCCDADDNIKVDEQLENHIKELFPIFNKIPFYDVYFGYQSGDPFAFGGILARELYLYIEFPKKCRDSVLKWLDSSFFKDYEVCTESISNSTPCLIFKVNDLIENLNQKQIYGLRKQLAEESISWWMNTSG